MNPITTRFNALTIQADGLNPVHLPKDVVKEILSYLDMQGLEKAKLVCKAVHIAASDFRLPQYRWILSSEIVQKIESNKAVPLIKYEGNIPSISNQRDVLKEYAYPNFFKRFCKAAESIKNWQELLSLHPLLELAAEQGSKPAVEILLEIYCFRCLTRDTEASLAKIERLARRGFEKAIDILHRIYILGRQQHLEIDKNDPAVRKKGLELAHHFAEAGSETAIQWLIDIYKWGYCGIDKGDPDNQAKGLELAKRFAHKGSEQGIKALLDAHICGCFGLTASLTESLKLAHQFSEKGSEHAIQIVINYYKSHLNPEQARKAREVADHHAKQGSNSSVDYLINHPDESNKENFLWKWWQRKQTPAQLLSEQYALQGHESAIQHIFENAKSMQTPLQIAERGHEVAIELLLKTTFLKKFCPNLREEGLRLAKVYMNRGSAAASRAFVKFILQM